MLIVECVSPFVAGICLQTEQTYSGRIANMDGYWKGCNSRESK